VAPSSCVCVCVCVCMAGIRTWYFTNISVCLSYASPYLLMIAAQVNGLTFPHAVSYDILSSPRTEDRLGEGKYCVCVIVLNVCRTYSCNASCVGIHIHVPRTY
jgi:hypothetical protein